MNSLDNKKDNNINVLDLLMYLLSKWHWFLLSLILFGGLAWMKYATTPLVYFRSATVIIKDPSNKLSTAGLDRYDNYINKVNVANEILQFRSKKLLRDVVRRVHADVNYQLKDGFRYTELYTQAPFAVSFPDALPGTYLAFGVQAMDQKSVMLGVKDKAGTIHYQKVQLNDTVTVADNRIVVTPTNYYDKSWYGKWIEVEKRPLEAVVAYYMGNIGIQQEEDESSIIKLAIKDNSPVRAEEVLNTLITDRKSVV